MGEGDVRHGVLWEEDGGAQIMGKGGGKMDKTQGGGEEGRKIEGEEGGGAGWQWGASCSASSGQGGLETMPRIGEDDHPQDTQNFRSCVGYAGATIMLSFEIFSFSRILSSAKTSP